MKKVILSIAAIMALVSSASADNYPAEGVDSYKSVFGIDSDAAYNRFYVGLGYSYMDVGGEYKEGIYKYDYDFYGNALTILAGYSVNRYFAIEGRYSSSVGDLSLEGKFVGLSEGVDFGGNMTNAGIYLKPKYTTPQLAVYALLGYGQFDMDIDDMSGSISENGFQWGLGIKFHGGEHFDIYLDYTNFYYDDEGSIFQGYTADINIDSFNVGLAYKF